MCMCVDTDGKNKLYCIHHYHYSFSNKYVNVIGLGGWQGTASRPAAVGLAAYINLAAAPPHLCLAGQPKTNRNPHYQHSTLPL